MGKIKKPFFGWYKRGKSLCSKCGETEGKFYRYWIPVNWFRGDDEGGDIYCENCKKLEEHSQTPFTDVMKKVQGK